MKELKFNLTVDDTNTILEALGNMPFAKVYGLIEKIQQQAQQQMQSEGQQVQMPQPEATEAAEKVSENGVDA